jgi:hypothetical protein
MTKNVAKYLSYKEAWRRVGAAIEGGFHFEAVAICESIISDRLLSYLHGIDPSSKLLPHSPFASLIKAWRQTTKELPLSDGINLCEAVDSWRLERNAVVHSLTKSLPGTATVPLSEFLCRAEAAAKTGERLAREVSKWHKRQLAAHKANYAFKRTAGRGFDVS